MWQTHWHHSRERWMKEESLTGDDRAKSPDRDCDAEGALGAFITFPLWKVFWQKLKMMLAFKSPLYPAHTHIIRHPVSASHPRGSRSSWHSFSTLCHVVSLLLCNFLFFLSPSSSLSRKVCLSRRNSSQVKRVKTTTFWCVSLSRSLYGAWRIPQIPTFLPSTMTPPEGMQ